MTTELLELGLELRARLAASEQSKQWLCQASDKLFDLEASLESLALARRQCRLGPKMRELEAS